MEGMSSALKQELHALVDDLPEEELHAARRFLAFLRDEGTDPNAHIDDEDPFADMPDEERERLHASLAQSRREIVEGKVFAAVDVIGELRARRR